jgi:transcription elongation factor Elf1
MQNRNRKLTSRYCCNPRCNHEAVMTCKVGRRRLRLCYCCGSAIYLAMEAADAVIEVGALLGIKWTHDEGAPEAFVVGQSITPLS